MFNVYIAIVNILYYLFNLKYNYNNNNGKILLIIVKL